MMRLMRTMREAIIQGKQAHIAFIHRFLKKQFPKGQGDVPSWVVDALQSVNITVALN
tara:strand:+ start:330 stop:500 length:171 start_codon:yes stop_codon:yes gene_type:complete